MNRRGKRVAACWLIRCGAVLLGLATPAIARAGFATPVIEATEVMIAAEQADASFIGSFFGPSPGSTLLFTSTVDPAGQSFSFTLASGSSYQGQAMTLTDAGTLNSSTGVWNSTSLGSLGATSWMGTGTQTITGDPMNSTIFTDLILPPFPPPPPPVFSLNVNIDYSTLVPLNLSTGTGTLSVLGHPIITVTSTDHLDPQGNITWNVATIQFFASSTGQSPVAGGQGNFNMVIQFAIPEPSTLIMSGTGVLCLLGYGGSRRLRRATRSASPP
jgi:hypothetical protein